MPAQALYEKKPVMGIGRVPDPVDRLYGGIDRRVEAYGVVRPEKVIVDGTGDTDDGDVIFFRENIRTGKSSVTANGNERIDVESLQGFEGHSSAFRRQEALASGCFENGASPVDDIAYVAFFQALEITFDHSLIAAVNAVDMKDVERSCPDDSPQRGIQARRIAAGSKEGYPFKCSFLAHVPSLCCLTA